MVRGVSGVWWKSLPKSRHARLSRVPARESSLSKFFFSERVHDLGSPASSADDGQDDGEPEGASTI